MTDDVPRLLKPGEVAEMFRVHRVTVARWGVLTDIRTPGGHRRYREDEVLACLDFGDQPMNVSAGAAGEVAPAETHERPAGVSPAEALPLAGRNGTGAPGRFGGAVNGERPCHQTPRTEEGSDE